MIMITVRKHYSGLSLHLFPSTLIGYCIPLTVVSAMISACSNDDTLVWLPCVMSATAMCTTEGLAHFLIYGETPLRVCHHFLEPR